MRRSIVAIVAWAVLVPAVPALGASDEDGFACMSSRDPDRGIPACTRIIDDRKAPPSSRIPAYMNRAQKWLRKGEFDRAFADFGEAIKLDPDDFHPHSARARAWCDKGDFDRAIADFNAALGIAPKALNPLPVRAEVLIERGDCLVKKGDFDRAIADYTESLGLRPDNQTPRSRRGTAYLRKGDYDRAIADFDQVIAEGNTDYYEFRAGAWLGKGDLARAIADLDEAIKRSRSPSASAYNSRCSARTLANRDLPLALADCNEALRLTSNNPSVLVTRGFAHLRLGRFDDAIADFDAVLKAYPAIAPALYGRGIAKLNKGDRTGGNADIAAAKAAAADVDIFFAKHGIAPPS